MVIKYGDNSYNAAGFDCVFGESLSFLCETMCSFSGIECYLGLKLR